MNGLHLTIDIYECSEYQKLTNIKDWLNISNVIENHNFTLVGNSHYLFEGGGFTAMWLLAESHVAVHTWPEFKGCTLDIYACDVNFKHEVDVNKLAEYFLEFLGAVNYHIQTIWRGDEPTYSDFVCNNLGLHYRGKTVATIKSKYQLIQIVDTERFGRGLKLDNILMSTDRDEYMYHEPMIHAPVILHGDPHKVIVIGGGDYGSVREALKHKNINRVDLAELDEEVLKATKKYCSQWMGNIEKDSRLNVHVGDGMSTFRKLYSNYGEYDVVVLDLTDPGILTNHLYQSYGLHEIKNMMSEHGILSCHLGLGMEPAERIMDTLNDLKKVFKYVSIYQSIIPSYGGTWLMACASETEIDWNKVKNYQNWDILNNRYWTSWENASIFVHPLVLTQHPDIREYICK